MFSRVLLGNPSGWTLYEFDHVATNDELLKLFSDRNVDVVGSIIYESNDTTPRFRYFYVSYECSFGGSTMMYPRKDTILVIEYEFERKESL